MTAPFLHLVDPLALPTQWRRPVLAIGNFDGVHRGHQALIASAAILARDSGVPAGILTFEPHPKAHFQPEKPLFRLSSPDLKARWAQEAGSQIMVTMTFDTALAALTAEEFVDGMLVQRLGVSGVVVGHDFHFGRNRQGSPAFLQARAALRGFAVAIVPPVQLQGVPVSSSAIRAALTEGDVALANRLLGREWAVRASVAHGDKRGRLLGYPTANLILDEGVTLKHGIYAMRATVDGVTHAAVASFGRRPTFDDGAPRLEVHLFDFSGDLYGKTMQAAFVGYIRPELKFDGVEALIRQMDQDSSIARRMLAA